MKDEYKLPFTGERLVPEFNTAYGTFEHIHRYALATNFCNDKNVLDIASGEGYGTNLLSIYAKKIYGVDISREAIDHARNKYNKSNIEFRQGSVTQIPIENNSIEIVVSFETIEHLKEQDEMLSEIKRVMINGGTLILSSPEKSIYSQRDQNNQFHLKELMLNELEIIIKKYFRHHVVLTQQMVIGSLIYPINQYASGFKVYDGSFDKIENRLVQHDFFNKPFFNIVICSDNEIKIDSFPNASFFSAYTAYSTEKENYLAFQNKIRNHLVYRLYQFIMKKLSS